MATAQAKRPRSFRKRLLITSCISLLAAAAASVALAWWTPLSYSLQPAGSILRVKVTANLLLTAPDGRRFRAMVVDHRMGREWILDPLDWELLPGERRYAEDPPGDKPLYVPWPQGPGDGVGVSAWGFPFPALRCVGDRHYAITMNPPARNYTATSHGTWKVEPFRGNKPAYLPTQVWWPGMLGDLAVLGSSAWLLLFGWGTLKRWRWGRTGRCTACGYDFHGLGAGSACPECGTTPTFPA